MTTSHSHTTSTTHPKTEHVSYGEKKQHLQKLLDKFKTGFLVSHAQADLTHGHYHARPMGLLDHDDNGDLWFATSIDSPKVTEIEADPKVLVTFQDDQRFVAITGKAVLERSRVKIEQLWSTSLKIWFDGPDDPKLVLVKVDANEASFWDNGGSRGLKYLFHAAKALVTGQKPVEQNSEKDNATLKL